MTLQSTSGEICIRGMPICRGIAIGTTFVFAFVENDIPEFTISPNDLELEVNRYRKAVEQSKEDIVRLKKQLEQERIVEGAAILDAHQQMMQDPLLTFEVEKLIRATRKNAEYVFHTIIKGYQKKFSLIADPFFRERFKDIQDISRRVMGYLLETMHFTLADIPKDAVIFAKDFTPSDIAEVKHGNTIAFVAQTGGSHSHTAIVAKAKGIPYVANVDFNSLNITQGQTVIVDGRTGDIIFNPSTETLARYRVVHDQLRLHMHKLGESGHLEAETYDGYSIKLSANIDMVNETDALHQYGCSGIGLYRSEYLFLTREHFPSEEEQFQAYRTITEKMRGLPVVIRTFDVGGDKTLASRNGPQESNPYLGCRAIRFLLKERDIFKAQLRAILRASVFGNISIMFPMIAALTELREAKQLVRDITDELLKNNVPVKIPVRIGCMIEVPSAAIISDLLAKECDFLSIGTNDLVQYALAVDRDNHSMSALYSPAHPSVIRLIKLVVTEANNVGIPITVCGEVAADPRFTPLLLGLGVHELSVACRYIPLIKSAVRNTSILSASQLADKVLSLSTGQEIENLLNDEYKKNVPEDHFYNY